ncbi:MAG: DUF4266 domain-containing protein [Deltaproteobacteria bacterium]|nr:DUF4266 domain-containing protein [Deltaproteobacteria bacterium]
MMNRLVAIVLLLLLTPACSSRLERVKPYEKEAFSKDKMLLNPMPLKVEYEEHILSIREASQGGGSSFQGGCGCK